MNKDGSYTFNIMKDGQITVTFQTILLDNNIIITKVYNITDAAPEKIKECAMSAGDLCIVVYDFIRERSVPNDYTYLDEFLVKAYDLRPDINEYRMYNHQYVLTLITGGISYLDGYYVLPENNEIISLVNLNRRFWRIWFIRNDISQEELQQKHKELLMLMKNIESEKNANGKNEVN